MKGNLIGNLKFDLKEIVFYGLFDSIFIRNFLKNKFQQKKNGLKKTCFKNNYKKVFIYFQK